MGALDAVINEAGSRFGIGGSKVTTLLSSLFSFLNEQGGGLTGLVDRFRRTSVGDSVSSWLGVGTPSVSPDQVEAALGRDTVYNLAAKSGIAAGTAAAALAFLIPRVIQRVSAGGVIPSQIPEDLTSYMTGPTAAMAAGARQAMYSAERVVEKGGFLQRFWPLLFVLALLLIGLWLWAGRSASNSAFNAEEQVRLAGQKASAALAALRPGFSANDLVGALNLEVINFQTASAQIPSEDYEFLNKTAAAIKMAPSGTVLEIGGHTDNTGDASGNQRLSQERADAVRDYLIKQDADGSAIIAKGYGDTRPQASNDTDEGRFRNRRIEFSVSK
jgi:outer membrane protein OmpA-like peptidoglycan-associated protein/uncharacterized protein YidB (DUF937 family)